MSGLVNPYFVTSASTTQTELLNPYFTFHGQKGPNDNETDLIAGMVQEAVAIRGFRMVYIPRILADFDVLFGEDLESKFQNGFEVPVYVKTFEGFNNSNGSDLASKFGLIVRDQIEITIARKTWNDLKSGNDDMPFEPREGDLIFFPTAGKEILEISWVEDESQFYPLGKQMTWQIKASTFQYNGETVDSNFENIDVVQLQTPSNHFTEMLENKIPQDISDLVKSFDADNPFGEF